MIVNAINQGVQKWLKVRTRHACSQSMSFLAVASGPAGPVLAGPVFEFNFKTAHAQMINNHKPITTIINQ